MEVRLEQCAKAPSPMLVTLLPMMTEVRLLQYWKVSSPMLVTLSGMVTLLMALSFTPLSIVPVSSNMKMLIVALGEYRS